MAIVNTLTVKLEATTRGFADSIKKASDVVTGLSSRTDDLGGALDKGQKRFSSSVKPADRFREAVRLASDGISNLSGKATDARNTIQGVASVIGAAARPTGSIGEAATSAANGIDRLADKNESLITTFSSIGDSIDGFTGSMQDARQSIDELAQSSDTASESASKIGDGFGVIGVRSRAAGTTIAAAAAAGAVAGDVFEAFGTEVSNTTSEVTKLTRTKAANWYSDISASSSDATDKISKFRRVVNSASGRVSSFTQNNRTLGDVIGNAKNAIVGMNPVVAILGTATVAAAAGFVKLTTSAAADAEQLQKAAVRTGTTAEELSQLQFAATQSGAGVEQLEIGLRTLNRTAAEAVSGNETLKEIYDELGISLTDNQGRLKDTRTLLGEVADGLNQFESAGERAALGTRILGEDAFGRLLPLLEGGSEGLNALSAEADRFGGTVSTQFADDSAAFVDNMGRLNGLLRGAKNVIAEALLPALNRFLEAAIRAGESVIPKLVEGIDNLRFQAYRAGIVLEGLAISIVNPTAAAGKFLQAIKLTREEFERLNTDFSEFGPRIEQLGPTLASLAGSVDESVTPAINRLNVEMGDAIQGAQTFAEALEEQIAAGTALGPLPATPQEELLAGLGELTGEAETFKDAWFESLTSVQQLGQSALSSLQGFTGRFADGVIEAAQGGKIAFADFFKSLLADLARAIIRFAILRVLSGFFGLSGIGNIISSVGQAVGGALEGLGTATSGGTPAPAGASPSGGAITGGASPAISSLNRGASSVPVAQPVEVRVFEATPMTWVEITDQQIAPRLKERQRDLGEDI